MSASELARVPRASFAAAQRETMDRVVSIEIVRVTERTAVAAAQWRGRGNEKAADQAAVEAMWRELNRLPFAGSVVIGEGERDEAPMLFVGEQVGARKGPKVDIAVAPLEGKTLCAKALPGAVTAMAMSEDGALLNVPDVYMDKIAIGPGYPAGIVDLDAKPEHNIHALAMAKGVKAHEITALILDRPRHADLIAAVRRTGAGGAADQRRRRRRRDPYRRPGSDGRRHLSRRRRSARGRARRRGPALHRRAVPGKADPRQ